MGDLRAVKVLVLALAASGCTAVLGIGEPGESVFDPDLTTVSVAPSGGAIADGADEVTVTVTVFDTTGRPMVGATVLVSATPPSGTEIDQPDPTTEAGVATAILTATRSGEKTITASVDFEDAAAQPTVTFVAGPPTRLVFLVAPSTTPAGDVIDPPVQVRVDDDQGNPVLDADDTISLAIGANPGNGALGGTTTVDAVAGVATFDDLTISDPGTGYTLVASAPDRASTTSPAFTVSP